ncbi:SNRNP40, partial [Symbiodinium sp. KB8]
QCASWQARVDPDRPLQHRHRRGRVQVWRAAGLPRRRRHSDRSASIMAPASSAAAGASSVHPRQRASLGATAHSAERLLHRVAWAPDGGRVAAGSADETVYVWHTTPDAEVSLQAGAVDPRLQYALPGHAGGVTDVSFSPIEPILASCATDGKVYLGEVKQA